MLRLYFAAVSSLSQESLPQFAWENTVSSKYWGSIVGGVFYDGPVLWSDLSISLPDKAGVTSVGLWVCRPLDSLRYNKNFGDEYDAYVSQSYKVGKDLVLSGTVSYQAIYDLANFADDLVLLAVRVDAPSVPFAQPYICFNEFVGWSDSASLSGWFIYGGLQREQKLWGWKSASLHLDYRIGYSGGALGSNLGFEYQRLQASVPIKLGRNLVVSPSVIGQAPLESNRTFALKAQLFFMLSAKWSF